MTGTDAADAMREERAAKREAAYEAWKARVNEVLMLHIGLIDEELCEQTARFLASEAWLIDGKPELENRHVLLIAKAVGYENRRDGLDDSQRFQVGEARDLLATWDLNRGDPAVYNTERVLADQLRNLLAIIEASLLAAKEADQ